MASNIRKILKEQAEKANSKVVLEEDIETIEEDTDLEESYPSSDPKPSKTEGAKKGKGGSADYPEVDFEMSKTEGKVKGKGGNADYPTVDMVGDKDGNTNKKDPVDPESYDKEEPNFDKEVVANMKKVVKEDKDSDDEDEDMDDEDDNDEDDEDEKVEEGKKKKMKESIEVSTAKLTKEDISEETSEHLDSIFDGEELSEEFSSKVREIFESAVIVTAQKVLNEKFDEVVADYNEKLEEALAVADEELEMFKEELSSRTDTYFEYVAEEWLKENQEAVHSNLRSELTESFIEGLKDLFQEHYIDVPEEKVALVEELTSELEEVIDEKELMVKENLELKNQIKNAQKVFMIKEHSRELSDNEKEKFESLAENLSFDDEDTFREKLEEITEAYFGDDLIVESSLDEDPIEIVEENVIIPQSSEVDNMISTMKRFLKK